MRHPRGRKLGIRQELTFVIELKLRMGRNDGGEQARLRLVGLKIGGHVFLFSHASFTKWWKREDRMLPCRVSAYDVSWESVCQRGEERV